MTTSATKPAKKGPKTPFAAPQPANPADVLVIDDVELGNPEVASDLDLQTRIEQVTADLEQAESDQAQAERNWSQAAAKAVLEEADDSEVAEASRRYQEAQARTSALAQAIGLLEQRQTAQDAQQRAERITSLRHESEQAHKAETAALGAIARASADLLLGLEDARAEGAVLADLHAQLASAQPEQAAVVSEDHRGALALISSQHAAKRAAVYEAADAALFRLQAPSDGTDPALSTDLYLLEDKVADSGTRYSLARNAVGEWQVRALATFEDQQRAAIEDEYQELASRTLVAGLGVLPASRGEVREAANLDLVALAHVVPEQASRALAGLIEFLPSPNEGTSTRIIRPRSAVEARQKEQRLEQGKAVLNRLAGNS